MTIKELKRAVDSAVAAQSIVTFFINNKREIVSGEHKPSGKLFVVCRVRQGVVCNSKNKPIGTDLQSLDRALTLALSVRGTFYKRMTEKFGPSSLPCGGKEIPKSKKHWFKKTLLSAGEANALFLYVASLPFGEYVKDRRSLNYGLSYSLYGGAAENEIPEIPDVLRQLADRVSEQTGKQVNYVQIHDSLPAGAVRPHRDPADMVVPMLTVGQARTFRVGGTMPHNYYVMSQSSRPFEGHVPTEEILMNHGDLLVFTGGDVIHSMYPTDLDKGFRPNSYDRRFSLLFRYTTEAMRKHGCISKRLIGSGHAREYVLANCRKAASRKAAAAGK